MKRIAIALLLLFALAVFAAGAAALWMQSAGGKRWLADEIARLASTPGEAEIAIGKLEGDLYRDLRFTDVTARDGKGVWLRIAAADIGWRPWDLLSGVLTLTRAEIRDMNLDRLPQSGAPAKSGGLVAQLEALRDLPAIRISRLRIEDLVLGSAVVGEKAVLRVRGGADASDGASIRATLAVARVDGKQGNVDIKATYGIADRTFDLDASAEEASGGLVARLADIPDLPAFRASARGAGPLGDWKGRAEGAFGQIAKGEADIAFSIGDRLDFTITGAATVPRRDGGPLRRLLSGDHRFQAAGVYAEEVLRFSDLQWSGSVAEIGGSGQIDSRDLSVEGQATVRKKDDKPLMLTAGGIGLATLAAEVSASGQLSAPQLRVSFDAGQIEAPGVSIASATGTAAARPDGSGRFAVEGDMQVKGLRFADRPAVQALTGPAATIHVAGGVDVAASDLRLDALRAALAHAEIDGSGRFGWADGTGTGKATITLPDLAALPDPVLLPVAGRLALTLDATVRDFGDGASATLSGRGGGLGSDDRAIAALLGAEAEMSATLSYADGMLDAKAVALKTGKTTLKGDLAVDTTAETLTGAFEAGIADGAAVPVAEGVTIACACTLRATLGGTMSEPTAKGDVALGALRLPDGSLRAIAATYDLMRLADAPAGAIDLRAEAPWGALTARTKAALQPDRLRLTALEARSVDVVLRGALDIPTTGGALDGKLGIEARSLTPLLAAAGFEGEGHGKGTVTLAANGSRQSVKATARLAGLQFRPAPGAAVIAADAADIALAAEDLLAGDSGELTIRLEKGGVGEATYDRISATASGSLREARLSLAAKGKWRGPVSLDATGRYRMDERRQSLSLSKLDGRFLGRALALEKPVTVAWGAGGIAAEPVALTYGGARLTGQAKTDAKGADVSLTIAKLPLALIDSFWPLGMNGNVDAALSFKGAWPEPDGRFSLSVPALRVDPVPDAPALAVKVSGNWQRGRLAVDGTLTAGDAPPSRMDVSLPFRIEGPRLFVDIPRDQPVSGTFSWSGETAALWRFAPLPEHLIRGAGNIDGRLAGTVAKPILTGRLVLRDGYYESLEYGTVLKPLDLTVDFDGGSARITRLTAGDGGSGKLTGKGDIRLDTEAGFPFRLDLRLEELAAVRRDDVQASATGDISFDGSFRHARIESKLTTDTVEVRVLDRLPPEVATLDVTEIGAFGNGRRTEKPEKPFTADIDLAIDVDMPRRVFVRGRGIESEWKGNLKVTGPAANPSVTGYVALVRGQISVVGKTFQMESGNVVLPEKGDAEPEMAVTAAYSGGDLTVRAQVEGPVSKPRITLTSVPPLPQDEIVSRVLFNKSSTKLSAYEAAQLALALAELTGRGGSGGILDFARKTLGVDVLQVESVETEKGSQPVVGAGKYVTDDVYVGVKQGATPESSSVGVQVDLTPNIAVESDVRRSGESDVGVKFKYDY